MGTRLYCDLLGSWHGSNEEQMFVSKSVSLRKCHTKGDVLGERESLNSRWGHVIKCCCLQLFLLMKGDKRV